MKIILISGKAQHGKDTFANLLMKNFEKYPIKDASRQISRIIADYAH